MGKKLKISIIVIIGVFIIVAGAYVHTNYQATETATAYLNGTGDVNVTNVTNGLFLDGPGNDTALIFYPGAKVEYTAYLPMFTQIASEGVDCYLVKMPINFAFLGIDSADSIINESNYAHYFMCGHSLGGVMAGEYVNHSSKVDGLILICSYLEKPVNVPVLSIYGSDDTVMNMDNYNKSKSMIVNNFTEFIVAGGNHAHWGNYGEQSEDSPSHISAEDQQKQGVDEIIRFIKQWT